MATLVMGAAACSSSERDDARTELEPGAGQTASPIINGVRDTTRDAVVSIYSEEGKKALLCTGTIVQVDPVRKIGLVLTAGHCVALTPKYVYVGDDFRARATLRYKVVDWQKHPLYDGGITSSYDFAFLRFAGADESTPTMPILSPEQDKLGPDSVVTLVGFGRTAAPPASSDNTTRQKIDRALSDADATKLTYPIASGGICNGDSGGPALTVVDGTEYIAGVHSYVTGNCDGNGVSGRISAAPAHDWVESALAEASPPASCELCDLAASSGSGVCRRMEQSCLADASCGNFARCVTNCADDLCRAACQQKYPLGVGPFNAVQQCACRTACTGVCQGSSHCAGTPKCGVAPAAGNGCGTCTESACCAELADCAADGTCYDCLQKQDQGEACAANTKRVALAACRERSCATSCDDENAEWADTTSGQVSSGFAPLGRISVTRGCTTSPTLPPFSSRTGALAALAAAGLLLRRRRRVR
ncbi:S1 family peptidase [Pendulispora albinea]|uniref:S1 family peptidase n=1 Tax=Pendulispora albinea TaxID=2741071 RepID=A0ABZ2M089_9BACT